MLRAEEVVRFSGAVQAAAGPAAFPAVRIDSRLCADGDLFVALPGEKADGHAFVPDALRRGALGLLTTRTVEAPAGVARFETPDTAVALRALGGGVRAAFAGTLVGIVGSAGKTTTKELTALALSPAGPVHASRGNFNNLFGFPVSALEADRDARHWVMEMGISTPGEMDALATLVRPDAVLFTNFRPVHLEFFGTLEAIGREKARVLEYVTGKGPVVVNADDPLLMALTAGRARVTYGRGAGADLRLVESRNADLTGQDLSFTWRGHPLAVRLPLWSEVNALNAAGALAMAAALGVDPARAAAALAGARPAAHRGEVLRAGGITLVDDSYNANPEAVALALAALAATPATRRVAVLGHMRELGPDAPRFHREVGAAARAAGLDLLCCVGPLNDQMAAGFGADARLCADWQDALAFRDELRGGDVVLVKGSRFVGLDRWVDAARDAAAGGA